MEGVKERKTIALSFVQLYMQTINRMLKLRKELKFVIGKIGEIGVS